MGVAGDYVLGVLGGSVLQQRRQEKMQRQALRAQEEATRTSLAAAQRQERLGAEAERRANMKKPDIAAILANAQSAQLRGPTSTILTGIEGVKKKQTLGETSLLGE
jgi:hypothetical protein